MGYLHVMLEHTATHTHTHTHNSGCNVFQPGLLSWWYVNPCKDLQMAPLGGGDCVKLAGEIFNKVMNTFFMPRNCIDFHEVACMILNEFL